MELDAFAGNIPSISKALKRLHAAYSSNSTIVSGIQDALIHLNFALLDENFIDSTIFEQFSFEKNALDFSLQHLTDSLTDVQLKLLHLQQLVTSSAVIIPINLSNTKEISTALHLAVCDPKINWSLANKSLNAFVSLTTQESTFQSIQSQKLLVSSVWGTDFFNIDIVTILKSGDAGCTESLNALNKIIGLYKDDIGSCSLLFSALLKLLLDLRSPVNVQKERLSVLLIARYKCPHEQYLCDDSIGLINSFLYSHKAAINIASSSLAIMYNLSHSDSNKHLHVTDADGVFRAAFKAMDYFKNNRKICYYGFQILDLTIRNSTYVSTEGVVGTRLLEFCKKFNYSESWVLNLLVRVKEAHISDQQIEGLYFSIKYDDSKANVREFFIQKFFLKGFVVLYLFILSWFLFNYCSFCSFQQKI